jgi:inhibitor of the pro-sigma K processing machinery
MAGLQTTAIIVIIAILVLLVFVILRKPIKIVFKLLLNIVIGFIALFAINYLGSFIGVTVAVNWINAVIVGVLGVPGVALILLLRWITVI